MSDADDLAAEKLEPRLGDRALRSSPVLLSTAISAAEWAAEGAPDGAVVVADSQIAPRGRAGRPLTVTPGRSLGFALVLRPELEAGREGWLYTIVLTALADVLGDGVRIEWPAEVRRGDELIATTGIEAKLGPGGVMWAVVNVLVCDAQPPRGGLLAAIIGAIEDRVGRPPQEVVEDYARLCATFGRPLHIRVLGGTTRLDGVARATQHEGALVLDTDDGREVAVRPQHVSSISAG